MSRSFSISYRFLTQKLFRCDFRYPLYPLYVAFLKMRPIFTISQRTKSQLSFHYNCTSSPIIFYTHTPYNIFRIIYQLLQRRIIHKWQSVFSLILMPALSLKLAQNCLFKIQNRTSIFRETPSRIYIRLQCFFIHVLLPTEFFSKICFVFQGMVNYI